MSQPVAELQHYDPEHMRAHTEEVLNQARASDQWAYFQAKSIRGFAYSGQVVPPLTNVPDAGFGVMDSSEADFNGLNSANLQNADGTFVLASTTFDSDEAATSALIDLGCARVVALDRGMHTGFFLHRAGTEPAPAARYETTVLDLVDAPMAGRAKRFGN